MIYDKALIKNYKNEEGKIPLDFHAPVVLPISPDERVFMARYDEGYPFTRYRLAYNPIGGNPSPEERELNKGPLTTLLREINEEIDYNPDDSSLWASPRQIQQIKKEVLSEIMPVADIFVDVPDLSSSGGRKEHSAIYSIFSSAISNDTIDMIQEIIDSDKKILTEGFAGVATIEKLLSGEQKLAHSSGFVFDKIFGKDFPKLEGATCIDLGDIRNSYKDYESDFVYGPKAFKS